MTFGWCFLLLTLVIVFDVVTRNGIKLWVGFAMLQILPPFQLNLFGLDLGSSRLQELQWHLHGIIFLTWIGYAYIRNAHVRIDILTSGLPPRRQAWLELIGCILFALPYLIVALPYAWRFFMTSYWQNESSTAPNGLPARYVIKGFLFFGFLSVLLAVISVAARRFVYLFGSPELAEAAMPAAKPSH
jgi:TRAP-type mannitol/chloroaromatic compound transport system permease small subunit